VAWYVILQDVHHDDASTDLQLAVDDRKSIQKRGNVLDLLILAQFDWAANDHIPQNLPRPTRVLAHGL
jgi:hypothetical protein